MSVFYGIDDIRHYGPRVWYSALALSVAFASAYLYKIPHDYIWDDGGIIVKYMDSFAQGAFYSYNPQDGPVFGISGFFHGILSGLLAATHILSPEKSVFASNYIGVILTSFTVLLILRTFSDSCSAILLGWATTFTAASYLAQTAFQGLETPLHIGFVLLMYWAFLSGRARTFWLLTAFCIISKLDSVPVVFVLGFLRFIQLFTAKRSIYPLWQEIRIALRWAFLPLAAWVAFATLIFGSPLPQTAYAKLYFHSHPAERFGFFMQWWTSSREYRTQIVIIVGAFLLFIAYSIFKFHNLALKPISFLAGCIGVIGLYCVYNPGERMAWYYTLPQILLILGGVAMLLSVPRLFSFTRPKIFEIAACVVLLSTLPFNIRFTRNMVWGMASWIRLVEPERMEVGKWIHRNADPSDRLFTGHGHIARYSGLYVYDYSGLNSPVVTDLIKKGISPLAQLQPEWAVTHGVLDTTSQRMLGYRLVTSFYNVSLAGYPAWRVWGKSSADEQNTTITYQLDMHDIVADGNTGLAKEGATHISGSHIKLTFTISDTVAETLVFGVRKANQPFTLALTVSQPGSKAEYLSSVIVAAQDQADLVNGLTQSCQIPLPSLRPGSYIEIQLVDGTLQEADGAFQILEPVVLAREGTF